MKPLCNRYFCHITIIKWCQIKTRTIRKCFLRIFNFLAYVSLKSPSWLSKSVDMTKNGPVPKTKRVLQSGMHLFFDKVWNKNHLSAWIGPWFVHPLCNFFLRTYFYINIFYKKEKKKKTDKVQKLLSSKVDLERRKMSKTHLCSGSRGPGLLMRPEAGASGLLRDQGGK